jgi:hypothetical protein
MLTLTSRAKAIVAAGCMALAAYGGWWLRDLQEQAVETARAVAEVDAQRRMLALANQVAVRTEDAIARIRIENRTVYNETQREIQTNTVYRDCVLPADGVRLANQARAGAGQPSGRVPAASAPASQGHNGRPAGR